MKVIYQTYPIAFNQGYRELITTNSDPNFFKQLQINGLHDTINYFHYFGQDEDESKLISDCISNLTSCGKDGNKKIENNLKVLDKTQYYLKTKDYSYWIQSARELNIQSLVKKFAEEIKKVFGIGIHINKLFIRPPLPNYIYTYLINRKYIRKFNSGDYPIDLTWKMDTSYYIFDDKTIVIILPERIQLDTKIKNYIEFMICHEVTHSIIPYEYVGILFADENIKDLGTFFSSIIDGSLYLVESNEGRLCSEIGIKTKKFEYLINLMTSKIFKNLGEEKKILFGFEKRMDEVDWNQLKEQIQLTTRSVTKLRLRDKQCRVIQTMSDKSLMGKLQKKYNVKDVKGMSRKQMRKMLYQITWSKIEKDIIEYKSNIEKLECIIPNEKKID